MLLGFGTLADAFCVVSTLPFLSNKSSNTLFSACLIAWPLVIHRLDLCTLMCVYAILLLLMKSMTCKQIRCVE